jgi:hypothetical protein
LAISLDDAEGHILAKYPDKGLTVLLMDADWELLLLE